MCGIAGIYSKNAISDKSQIVKMTNSIAHRGPDGEGHWFSDDQRVALGHRRLSIIDLSSGGNQPMFYADRYVLIFNGEIYNYVELKKELQHKGYGFKSGSDTEVLLCLYHDLKEKCLEKVDGMFAFAIWDKETNHLFCARDRFGEKPFFYRYNKGKSFEFASEIKALKKDDQKLGINLQMCFGYMESNDLFNPLDKSETFYDQIFKLEPGHFLIVDGSLNLSKNSYWQLKCTPIENATMSFEDCSGTLFDLLKESTERRLRSDVPVGSSLSGGIDSSIVVCLMNYLAKSNQNFDQHTFSAIFPGFELDEKKYIDIVNSHVNATPHYVLPDEGEMIKEFEKLLFHQDEPIGTSSIYAQYKVMEKAKQDGITVLLDGQGADEVFAGYRFYFKSFFQELWLTDKKKYRSELKGYKELYGTDYKRNADFYFSAYLHDFTTIKNSVKSIKRKLDTDLTNDFYNLYSSHSYAHQVQSKPDLNSNLLRHTVDGALEVLLRYSDRNSMAHSREVRLPFLYHKLVEFVFTLPVDYKIHHGWTKYILRETFKNIVPLQILTRKDKIGYATPESTWLKSPLIKDQINESISYLIKENILKKPLDSTDNSKKWRYWMVGRMLANQ